MFMAQLFLYSLQLLYSQLSFIFIALQLYSYFLIFSLLTLFIYTSMLNGDAPYSLARGAKLFINFSVVLYQHCIPQVLFQVYNKLLVHTAILTGVPCYTHWLTHDCLTIFTPLVHTATISCCKRPRRLLLYYKSHLLLFRILLQEYLSQYQTDI